MSLASADQSFLCALAAQLPEDTIRPADARFHEEPRGRWRGAASHVALPRTTSEVATIVAHAHAARVPLVPYGGGTGLVGGQIAPEGGAVPLLVSLERMSAIRAVHPDENVLIAEAGAILLDVQNAAREANRLFPLSLASEGSARIGGLLGTNAGGVNVLRYGNARDLCLGLEAVMPDGTVWNGLRRLRKDNTGYDLRNLLIGAEGTLGIITAAVLKLSPIPARTGTALLVVDSPRAALDLLARARDRLGDGISAFELMSGTGYDFLRETIPELRQPFEASPDWSVLIEVGLPEGLDPAEALEAVFADALEAGLVSDGLIAQSDSQRQDFWAIRERIPEANRHIGAISSHDISVPISEIPDFIPEGIARLKEIGAFRVNCFGHLGDGNLHYNVFPMPGRNRDEHENSRDAIKRVIHDLVHEMGGSVSAEHGIGRLKVADLERYQDPAKLAAMRAIKSALDPQGIMNPGAVLRMPD
ncbi:putative FAD-linked oxidoreductase [Roseivivax sp. THAF40]|uniref:FAD-binding oxidoreductase n=1 Tax=unclassified Roseivivax TaxID=2639302 RepID=UPI001267C153|nr:MULTISPECIES: FAD-binding oxidoreductase [unclassified Roseivivax]QFS81870.1 putative FAD-linked oxidoreductase [Roseivivax sp. THAF197b]QFT45670.1 putative FAD-linked oxidoreductase [Roseivivax sp. THAF40]